MFYSQFILAKKGPLGTIWIAAHLERKLRKNQVADTDIGVSVDSILSPDVPIALRLSSHLLLGVVRIYSKKVNYLFDDCSEALLKIKQAFRSAAVDLAPEESKAPYHSITLPETFDLDDFELPDNDIFHGNFVDHHISSREQITLQDTMEGVSYSTSKFGLDERFGDGDASGLDLDEELFLNKIDSAGQANESSDPQASSVLTNLVIPKDEQPETRTVNSRILVDLELELDDDADHMDYAQAPCTPGLVDEPNLSNVQEVSAFDDHLESECHLAESTVMEKTKNADEDKQEFDWCSANNKICDGTSVVDVKENDDQPVDMENNLSKQDGESPAEAKGEDVSVDGSSPGSKLTSASLDKELNLPSELTDKMVEASDVPFEDGLWNGSMHKDNDSAVPVDEPRDDYQDSYDVCLDKSASEVPGQISTSEQGYEGLPANDHGSLGVEVPGSVETATDTENQDESHPKNADTQAPLLNPSNINAHENIASTETGFLLPCQSNVQEPDSEGARSNNVEIQPDDAVLATSGGEELQGKACQITDNTEENLKGNHIQDVDASSREPEGEVHNEDSHDKPVENKDKLAEVEFPAPETLLSAPGLVDNQHKNLLIEESPGGFVGLDEGDAGSKNISGKKRSFTESTLTEQSLNSVESSRLVQFKTTVGSVPDDDDLLSSILAGRSSVLKVKPTPRLSEATSVKRTRLTSRTVTPKRKVLMDDTMVLHGDTIRQQLTNTEDIRRVRKKAPCTLPEISMIQKQHLEEEIFLGSTFTGVSSQLSSLHSQVWDLRRITVFKSDFFDDAFGQIVVETGLRSEKVEKAVSPNLTSHDVKNDDSLLAVAEPPLPSESAETCQTLDTKTKHGPGEPNVTERSEVTITGEVLVDGDNRLAEQIVDTRMNEGGIKEMAETNVVNGQGEATGPVEPDFSLQELLPDENGVEKGQKDDDAVAGDASGVVQEVDINETGETNASPKADSSGVLPDEKTYVPSVELEYTPMDIDNEQTINSLFMEKDSGIDAAPVEPEPVVRDDFLSGVVNDGGNELFSNAEHEDIVASMYPTDVRLGDDGFMNNGENPEQSEGYQNYMMNPDHPGFDLHEQEELNYYGAGNDTEFLNVDDDELADMADDQDPDDEEARFAENTGWSSRTRAVSKYLQTLFIKEAEHGRKSLSTDNLLVGKSRKEASRMFFEALVLKTRDYIHVEQRNPFDDITIKPRARLLKSDF